MAGYGSGVRTTPTGQDLFSRFAHGVLQGYLSKREQEMQQEQKIALAQQAGQNQLAVQGAIDNRTHYTQGQMNDRSAASLSETADYHKATLALHRESLEAAKKRYADKKHTANYMVEINRTWSDATPEWKRDVALPAMEQTNGNIEEAKKVVGNVEKKGPTPEQLQNDAHDHVVGWQKYRANNDPSNQGRFGFFPQMGYEKPPNWEGQPLPEQYDQSVQTVMEQGYKPQEATNIVYAAHTATTLGHRYNTDFRNNIIDLGKLRTLPALEGAPLDVPESMGKTSIGELSKLTLHGWKQGQLQKLLDQYFGFGVPLAKTPK